MLYDREKKMFVCVFFVLFLVTKKINLAKKWGGQDPPVPCCPVWKNKTKKLETLFYYLGQENWFMRTYLHKTRFKILQLLSRAKIQKIFYITLKYFSILTIKLPANWVAHITRDFLICYSCSYYSSMDVHTPAW